MRQNKTLRCLIFGDQTLPVQCAEILVGRGHVVTGVVTNDAAFRDWAVKRDVPHTTPGASVAAFARNNPFDCVFSIVNGSIVPDEVLERGGSFAINFHDGPLPALAGFNVTNWAILNGSTRHGITWHQMHSRLDAGAIYKQVLFDISPRETAFTLNAKCYEAALTSFPALVDELASGRSEPRPQDLSTRTYIPRYRRPSGYCAVDWQQTVGQIDALCRALDFGPYPNPMGLPKFWNGAEFICFSSLEAEAASSLARPGEYVLIPGGDLRVGAADGNVVLRGMRRLSGEPWIPETPSGHLPNLDAGLRERLTELHSSLAKHEAFWTGALLGAEPLSPDLGANRVEAPPEICSIPLQPPSGGAPDIPAVAAAFLSFWMRSAGSRRFLVGYQDDQAAAALSGLPPVATSIQPLLFEGEDQDNLEGLARKMNAGLSSLTARGPLLVDLAQRYPELRAFGSEAAANRCAIGIRIVQDGGEELSLPLPGHALTLIVPRSGTGWRLAYDANRIGHGLARLWVERIAHALRAAAGNPSMAVSEIPVMAPEERERLLNGWNETARAFESGQCVHELFERQALARPEAPALAFENSSLTYAELNRRANQVAHYLRSLGAGPNRMVGVFFERSIDLVVALMGVLKSGAAYLPIDPAFPAERRAFMLEDTQAKIVLTQRSLAAALDAAAATVVILDSPDAPFLDCPGSNPPAAAKPDDLAYVIHTSGSTGRPKGVEITHRNVTNFFAGMDDLNGSDPGVWLAVTSISFDISVFELFWTLARGFKIVLASEEHRALVARQSPPPTDSKPPLFSLFYFSSEESDVVPGGKYGLLLEGARFADSHGFHALWTPERHFHAFGGLYPNPSLTSAAVAVLTKNIKIRSGSVVLPLHHPLRVAEEWSVVDNLSGGRVGISFASGWHARDFVLAPQNYKNSKDVMFENIETVRRLWKGESASFTDGQGNPASVSILPRPVQSELPVWVTAAGNPETFRMAGERGFNILTHLLGQKLESVAEKIKIYREARAAAGFDPEQGQVTLMLHTYVANTTEEAREAVRLPLKQYLRSSMDLIKKSPWSFPAFTNKPNLSDVQSLDLSTLSEADLDVLLDYSFERYFETSGLFGTPEDCAAMAGRVRQIGVNEIACLIDFGVNADLVVKSLPLLNEVRRRCAESAPASDFSLPAQLEAHGVTHMQCTPSLAKMLASTPDSRQGIARLDRFFVGGEALPPALAADLSQLVRGEVHNMYGPTETTVWSTTACAAGDVVIGRPIANTSIYILDQDFRPVQTGAVGELFIGGEGVARGYLGQPELTAAKFLPDPFRAGGRIYRTGDLARYRLDGAIEYLGRTDHQVKIRGYRVELGEIESALMQHPAIRDCVVATSQMDTAPALLAYYTPGSEEADAQQLRSWLKQRLPDYMLPAQFIKIDRIPLTPNGKVDRKALPAPAEAAVSGPVAPVQFGTDLERDIAAVWRAELNRTHVGLDDNFFDLGGHSILVVQVNAKLRAMLNKDISLVEIFRFPTIRSLAKHLGGEAEASNGSGDSSSRAALRRGLMANRRAVRQAGQTPAAVESVSGTDELD